MRAKLRIEKLVYGGAGLARHGGAAVFVPYVLPGEDVKAEIADTPAKSRRAAPLAWVTEAPGRADPPCPVFARCGGCHYQHMPYELELDWKVRILRETLRRIGRIEWERDIKVVSASPWGYRNRAQLRIARQGGRVDVGFRAPRSHTLVPADACAINSPKLNELHGALQELARSPRFPQQLGGVELFTDERRVQLNLPRRPGSMPKGFWRRLGTRLGAQRARRPLDYRCGRDSFRVSGRSFFQVNRFLAGKLAGLAVGAAAGRLALDLYCGVGLLTLPLARSFATVVGVDSAGSAVRDLQCNATRAGLRVRAVHSRVDRFLRHCSDRPDLVVADPPRAGLGREAAGHLARLAPARLNMVSCDPATLARDLEALVEGGFRLERLTLVDFFPQTYHIETVAELRR